VVEEATSCLGGRLELRVCVTGPLELYAKRVGLQVEGDLLRNLAKSVSRFVSASLLDGKRVKTTTVSIDEPSLGLNPNLVVDREDLVKAFDVAAKPAKDLDVQVHLHSSNSADLIYETKHVKIIGVESAGDPRALENIDPSDLESYDRFLRAGVSRTNIYQIMAESGLADPWRDPAAVVGRLESRGVIGRRLRKAYKVFGDRIKYAGPDCGLGAWPDQESAFVLLKNTAKAVEAFNSALRRA
jgi:5-methyltetrahydropteroyltriglutamate--homocysteine methyltransferase